MSPGVQTPSKPSPKAGPSPIRIDSFSALSNWGLNDDLFPRHVSTGVQRVGGTQGYKVTLQASLPDTLRLLSENWCGQAPKAAKHAYLLGLKWYFPPSLKESSACSWPLFGIALWGFRGLSRQSAADSIKAEGRDQPPPVRGGAVNPNFCVKTLLTFPAKNESS